MKILLIGDSIICNHSFPNIEAAKSFLGVNDVETRFVSTKASYITSFDGIDKFDTVIVSSLLNHVSDLENRWDGPYHESKANDVYNLITEFVKITADAAKENPNTKIIVLPPTPRVYPKWLCDNLDAFKGVYLDSLKSTKVVTVADDPPIADTDLKLDGVHLERLALERFKKYIKDQIKPADEEFSNDDEVRIDSPILSQPEKHVCNEGITCHSQQRVEGMLQKLYDLMSEDKERQKVQEKQIKNCEEKVTNIEVRSDKIDLKFSSLQISTAKLKEDMDSLSNSQRRNVLIIKKLDKDPNLKLPTDMRAKSIIIKNLLIEELKKLPVAHQKEFAIRSIFVIKSPEFPNQFQDFRLFCLSPADATEIRNRILKAKSMKSAPWSNIEIHNDPVRSTRVRLFLLQAMARKMRPKHDGDIIVSKYADAPSIILKKDNKTIQQLSYVQAIIKHGHLLSTDDVERASNIAGELFYGSMRDYFLVLEDKSLPDKIPTPRPSSVSDATTNKGPSSFASGVKRKHREDLDNYNEKNKRKK